MKRIVAFLLLCALCLPLIGCPASGPDQGNGGGDVGGKTFIDLLCETFTPAECGVTLDTYWVQAGGGDPAWWLRNLKGRVDCVHFKDMVFSPEDKGVRMAAIGEGNMNYPEILKACDDAHVEYGFVEQDNCYGEDPFLCLKRSYEYLTAQGLD